MSELSYVVMRRAFLFGYVPTGLTVKVSQSNDGRHRYQIISDGQNVAWSNRKRTRDEAFSEAKQVFGRMGCTLRRAI